jgi:hypothetical protein
VAEKVAIGQSEFTDAPSKSPRFYSVENVPFLGVLFVDTWLGEKRNFFLRKLAHHDVKNDKERIAAVRKVDN